jgi:hypothetical protein
MATIPKAPPPKKRNYSRAPVSILSQYRVPEKGTKEAFTAIMGGGGLSSIPSHPSRPERPSTWSSACRASRVW